MISDRWDTVGRCVDNKARVIFTTTLKRQDTIGMWGDRVSVENILVATGEKKYSR